jgi:hydroxymethylpyrimidine/phosphomethylpyrimidine kinase
LPGASRSDERIPIALTIAGSDSSGGAGIQADLKTFHQFGVYGTSVITALTAQNTMGISAIHTVPPEFVVEQYLQVMSDIGADAVKTGMLVSAETITALAEAFDKYPPPNLVVDPVMISGTGVRLLEPSATEVMIELIFPRVTVITPNLDEAAAIVGSDPIVTIESMAEAAEQMYEMGPQTVLVKGGHLLEGEDAVDILYDGEKTVEFRASRLNRENIHGTGCAHSAAITAGLACSGSIRDSISAAKKFISEAIRNARRIGNGALLPGHGIQH